MRRLILVTILAACAVTLVSGVSLAAGGHKGRSHRSSSDVKEDDRRQSREERHAARDRENQTDATARPDAAGASGEGKEALRKSH